MSAKWIRSQAWERTHLTGWLTPVRWVLHLFSTIKLAVILLTLVTIYGTLASVPVGMLALIPTNLFYGLTLALVVAAVAVAPTFGVSRLVGRKYQAGSLQRTRMVFLTWVIGMVLLAPLGFVLWDSFVWPHLRYSETSGEGVRFFSEFVNYYKSVTVRRLPGMEMTELEFYAWWPLVVVLYLFVINMTVATIRRIEFKFANLGVLTVHTGIITIALGSAYYGALKQEGDTLLTSGQSNAQTGQPTVGPEVAGFYDNIDVVLRVRQQRPFQEKVSLKLPPGLEWEQRPIVGMPRYNDYNLGVVPTVQRHPGPLGTKTDGGRTLDALVKTPPVPWEHGPLVDLDVDFRIVGYAQYAELTETWVKDSPLAGSLSGSASTGPGARKFSLMSAVRGDQTVDASGARQPVTDLILNPAVPAERVAILQETVGIELTRQMDDARWKMLAMPLPDSARGGLAVEIPALNTGRVYPITGRPGQVIRYEQPTVPGQPGLTWTFEIIATHAEPPIPIVTATHRNAKSSVAIVRVTPPEGLKIGGKPVEIFERYIYSRFPELNQDLFAPTGGPGGQPRRAASNENLVRLSYLDASVLQVHLDERIDGTMRSIVRLPGQTPKEQTGLKQGDEIAILPAVGLRIDESLANARRAMVPVVTAEADREREAVGTHRRSAAAIEVQLLDRPKMASEEEQRRRRVQGLDEAKVKWSTVVWVPFHQYVLETDRESVAVALPDGRVVDVSFGRQWRTFGGLTLQLKDFEMIPYPYSTQPKDFRSDLLVNKYVRSGEKQTFERATSLNAPLLETVTPIDPDATFVGAYATHLAAKLGPGQFKFSQSGWDNQGWTQTKEMADAGQLPRPIARFTILGVGNNPGIYVIAFGSILICLGTPWAFYVKPWLIKRQKEKIQAQLKAGTYVRPGAARKAESKPQPAMAGAVSETQSTSQAGGAA